MSLVTAGLSRRPDAQEATGLLTLRQGKAAASAATPLLAVPARRAARAAPQWHGRRAGPNGGIIFLALATAAVLWADPAAAQQADPSPAEASFWSRVTLELPVYTHHLPHDEDFNDHNWGAFVDVALTRQWSAVGGYFRNSYDRETAFAAIAYAPINLTLAKVDIDLGGLVGLDLNGGYRPFNDLDPLLGALTLRVSGSRRALDQNSVFRRLGLLTTIIPAAPGGRGSTAINVALTYRFD